MTIEPEGDAPGERPSVVPGSEPRDPAPRPARRGNQWFVRTWVTLVLVMVPVWLVGAWLLFRSSGKSAVDGQNQQLAQESAGAPVQVFTGTKHTVYQSMGVLPTEAKPRADGLPTLIWFTTTNCGSCHTMDPFVYTTAHEYLGRMAFAEKAIDRSTDAARYKVADGPTFVLIGASGKEVARFGFEPTAAALKQAIDSALPGA